MVSIPAATTITGVAFVQITQGVYTANNYNGVALYSNSGGTLSLVASSANNGALWKNANNTYHAEPFSATVAVQPGSYYIAFILNESAMTTNPVVAAGVAASSSILSILDLPNSVWTYGRVDGINTLPPTQLASGGIGITSRPWLALY
jgi:hypothetical protein